MGMANDMIDFESVSDMMLSRTVKNIPMSIELELTRTLILTIKTILV